MSTNKINIEAVNARAREEQTPMSTPTELERVVEAILNRNSPIEIADFKGKERIAKEIATYAQTVAEEAVRAERERVRIELGQKLTCSLYYQGSPIINKKDVEKALTPLPDKE